MLGKQKRPQMGTLFYGYAENITALLRCSFAR